MEKRKVQYNNGLGEVTYVKKPLNKSIRITIENNGNVRVSLPIYYSWSSAAEFLFSVQEKIIVQRKNILYQNSLSPQNVGTKFYPFSKQSILAQIYQDQKVTQVSFKELHYHAHKILPQRVESLYKLMTNKLVIKNKLGFIVEDPFRYNRVTIKNNKTNWGSCSGKRNINLNINLIRLPIALMDYVIAHELCHLVYFNHGSNFHSMLNVITGGREKELSKQLNKFKLL